MMLDEFILTILICSRFGSYSKPASKVPPLNVKSFFYKLFKVTG